MKKGCCWLWQQHQHHYDVLIVILRSVRGGGGGRIVKYVQRYSEKFSDLLSYPLIMRLRAFFCLWRQSLQSFYYDTNKIGSVIITDTIAWLSVYSSDLPLPIKLVWFILSCYYNHHPFHNRPPRSQATSL
jgi:hypothetical protein